MKTRDGANTAVVTRERYVLDGALDETAHVSLFAVSVAARGE